ncbi:hypothetical protein Tco_0913651 [Tanacetum coccineum]
MEPSTPPVTALSEADAEDQVDQTQSNGFEVSVPDQNKSKTSSIVELDSQPLVLTTVVDVQALIFFNDEFVDENEDDVFEAGDEMDEDIQQDDKEETQSPNPFKDSSTKVPTEEPVSLKHQSPTPHKEQSKSCHSKDTDASDSESSSCSETFRPYDNFEKHEEVVVSYADLMTSIEEYYEENFDNRD